MAKIPVVINPCFECGGTNVSRERRPNGFTRCLDCGYWATHAEWDTVRRAKWCSEKPCVTHHAACACREAEMEAVRARLASLEAFAEAVRVARDRYFKFDGRSRVKQADDLQSDLHAALAKLDGKE